MDECETTRIDLADVSSGNALPGLSRLGLSHADLEELKSQGFVGAQSREPSRPCFVLRFRSGGRQKVRYIGTDPVRAEQIRRELAALQEERKHELELGRLTRQARRMLRETKVALEPVLNATGYIFHGRAIRRPRSRAILPVGTMPQSTAHNDASEDHDDE